MKSSVRLQPKLQDFFFFYKSQVEPRIYDLPEKITISLDFDLTHT